MCVSRVKFRYWCVEDIVSCFANVAFLFLYFLEVISSVDRDDFREIWYQFNRLSNEADRHLERVQADDDSVKIVPQKPANMTIAPVVHQALADTLWSH